MFRTAETEPMETQMVDLNPTNFNPVEEKFPERLFIPPSNPRVYQKIGFEKEKSPITNEEWLLIGKSLEDIAIGDYFISDTNESAEELIRRLEG